MWRNALHITKMWKWKLSIEMWIKWYIFKSWICVPFNRDEIIVALRGQVSIWFSFQSISFYQLELHFLLYCLDIFCQVPDKCLHREKRYSSNVHQLFKMLKQYLETFMTKSDPSLNTMSDFLLCKAPLKMLRWNRFSLLAKNAGLIGNWCFNNSYDFHAILLL